MDGASKVSTLVTLPFNHYPKVVFGYVMPSRYETHITWDDHHKTWPNPNSISWTLTQGQGPLAEL